MQNLKMLTIIIFSMFICFANLLAADEPEDMIDNLKSQYANMPSKNAAIDGALDGFYNSLREACIEDSDFHSGVCHPQFQTDRCEFAHTKFHMQEFLEDFYSTGMISDTMYYTKIPDDFKNLAISPADPFHPTKEKRWEKSYLEFTAKYKLILKSASLPCAQIEEVSNTKLCCNGYYPNQNKLIFSLGNSSYETKNPSCGGKSGEQCSAHTDCCSRHCLGLADSNTGTCEAVKTCFELRKLNEDCDEQNPYCAQGRCEAISWDVGGMNNATADGLPCSIDLDCSSNSCAAGICEEKRTCTYCTKAGKKPTSSRKCCSGTYHDQDDDLCKPATPPFVLPPNFNVKVERTLWDKIIHFIIPNVYAQPVASPNQSSHDDINSQLDDGQNAALEKKAEECADEALGDPDSTQRKQCYDELNEMRRDFLKDNVDGSGSSPDYLKGKEAWADQFGIPGITAYKHSDFNTCQINSFLDQWLDAGVTERNAEIVLRAFEVAFSGKVTKDMQPMKGQSLNYTLKKFTQTIRTKRIEMTNKLREMDVKMFCKCVISKGITVLKGDAGATGGDPSVLTLTAADFPAGATQAEVDTANTNRKTMWDQQCIDEKKEYDERMAKRKEGEAEEADTIAGGQPARKFLAEWAAARSEHQMDRLDAHADLEIELDALLDDIKYVDWEQSTKTDFAAAKKFMFQEFNNEHGSLNSNGNLYNYEVWWWNGWVKWAVGALLLVFSPALFLANYIGGIPTVALMMLSFGTWDTIVSIMSSNGEPPTTQDKTIGSEDCGSWPHFKCSQKYERVIFFENYDNSDYGVTPGSDLHCNTFGARYNCIKNFYVSTLDPVLEQQTTPSAENYKKWYANYKNYKLIDLWLPAFYNDSPNYFTEDMYFVETLNEARLRGLLMYSAPANTNKNLWSGMMGPKRYNRLVQLFDNSSFSPMPSHGTAPGSSKFNKSKLSRYDMTGEYFKFFLPDFRKMGPDKNGKYDVAVDANGDFVDKYQFGVNKIEEYKRAVKKYASCYKLVDCGYTGNEPDKDKLIGFAGYFQTEGDLESFANYVYQLHFLWPNLQAYDDRVGYPTIGLVSYLDGILYNLKILGSLNAARGRQYTDVASAYEDAFDQAGQWFDATGTETNQGGSSRNIEVLRNRQKAFDAVLLAAKGVGSLSNQTASAVPTSSGGGGTNAGNMNGVSDNIKKFAKTLENDRKKKAAYDKYFGNTKRGKVMTERSNDFLKKFSNPLGNAQNNLMASVATSSKVKDAKSDDKLSNDAFMLSNPSSNFNYSATPHRASSYGKSKSSSKEVPLHGLRQSQIDDILHSAKEDDSLRNIGPKDTIFHIVSKAYKRNLDRVLTSRATNLAEEKEAAKKVKKQPVIDSAKKKELKNLLGQ